MHSNRNLLSALTLAVVALLGAPALSHAAACTATTGFTSSIGNASTDDVTLGSKDSSACVISDVNPAQGPNGDTSGFTGTFGSGWSLLSKGPGSATVGGVDFSLGFTQLSGTTGTWSLTTNTSASFDLVFAMHAANRSGAFLFNDDSSIAAVTQNGTWKIQWLNNGGQVPDYSNVNFFVRDVAITPVPEPETYLLMLAGLGLVGFTAKRRSRV